MKKSVLLISTLLATTAGIGTAQSAEKLGEHPAVIVARNASARGIDPNTFIVAHPARLQLVAASPTVKEQAVASTKTSEASAAAGR